MSLDLVGLSIKYVRFNYREKINLKYTYNNVTTKLLKTNYQLVISKIT